MTIRLCLASGMRTLGIVAVLIVLIAVGLWIWSGKATERAERKRGISWWGARNGWRYTAGTDELLDLFPGEPFNRGTSHDVQDLLSGTLAGRPALIAQFSWYYAPDLPQASSVGSSGLKSGVCAAVIVELPIAVPALSVRRTAAADVVRGGDISFESERFNSAYRVESAEKKFAYDVVNPRLMAFLLDDPRPYSFRLDGPMLVVWRDGKVDAANELGELAGFALEVLELIPPFVFDTSWPVAAGQTAPRVSEIPVPVLGEAPTGSVAFLQKLEHRGRSVERYEHFSELWGEKAWAVVVKVDFPTIWPVCMVVPKVLAPARVIPRFTDEYLTGDDIFDQTFAVGTPRPDFAKVLLTPEFTAWWRDDPRSLKVRVIFQSEFLTPADDNVTEDTYLAQVSLMAHGRLSDQPLADHLTDLTCDLADHLPPASLSFNRDA